MAECLAAPARAATVGPNASAPPAAASGGGDLFHDPQDGAFDVGQFLSTRAGFLPLLMPITEPAAGYGLMGGLVFFHTPRLRHARADLRTGFSTSRWGPAGCATERGTSSC